ncbi:helix-turn-helix domain-containing protein [Bengtsoniella intestinalis]|uniref:helix-turn-helix domain-containing protein n=1 Tax=Bengtsoniella intestinalis TaxID=3073143 RepID=UPI00391EF6ED
MGTNYPETLTVKDVQQILNIGINGAYALIHSKAFPVRRIGNSYRIPRDSFFTWLNQEGTPPPIK